MQIRYRLESAEGGKYTWPKSDLAHKNITCTRLGTDMIVIFHDALRYMTSNLFFSRLRKRFVWNISIIKQY
jgi:hypothetical protein